MDALLTKEIETDKLWPFPRIKKRIGPTIFPRRKLLPANSSSSFSSFEEAKEFLDKEKIKGEVVRIRNTSKDVREEILDDTYYDKKEDAIFVKEKLEHDDEDFQILVNVRDISFQRKKQKCVKMYFLSDRQRNAYIKTMEKEGYIFESILLEEEQKKEEFLHLAIYDHYDDAKEALTLLENNYHEKGKITHLPNGLYEMELKVTRDLPDKLYILDASIVKEEKSLRFELFIERIQKGYDYVIKYF